MHNGATRDVADRSAVLASPSLDQPFIVGPGLSPVPAKLVPQIVTGKNIDVSDSLAVNLVLREREPQLLFDGRLVLTSQPKKQLRHIKDGGLYHLFPHPGLSPKSAVASPNVAVVPQVPRGCPLGLRLPAVEEISGCSPWTVDYRISFPRLLLGLLI